ncbi:hypothetical protein AB0945_41840 [Streptomyces sp. NPDC005474]|uniref:hypothetical protein n=1 Tax=Streptomyces sp. NPDC005474 TaxID=3154878 RepID=UPI0034544B30
MINPTLKHPWPRTTLDHSGIGLTDTLLMDEKSMIGRAAQTLFVTPAPATPT